MQVVADKRRRKQCSGHHFFAFASGKQRTTAPLFGAEPAEDVEGLRVALA